MKKMYLIAIGLLSLITICTISCSKDDININLSNLINPTDNDNTNSGGGSDDNSNSSDSTGTSSSYKLYFRAGVLTSATQGGFAVTTGTDGTYVNIGTGRIVDISAFNNTNSVVQAKEYESLTSGTLSPSDDDQMVLASGVYDFYAAGVNVPAGTAVPSFTFSSGSATASSLQNKMDYIWGDKLSYTPNATSNEIDFKMTHCCTQIIVNLTAESGVTINSSPTPLFGITPSSTNGISWNLTTGIITPADELTSTTTMSVGDGTSTNSSATNAYNGQITMMPLAQITDSMTCTFSVTINNESSPRVYSLKIPPYKGGTSTSGDGGYQAGYSYTYNTTLSVDTITFNATNSVQVKNWQIVNIDGVIIPTQTN